MNSYIFIKKNLKDNYNNKSIQLYDMKIEKDSTTIFQINDAIN